MEHRPRRLREIQRPLESQPKRVPEILISPTSFGPKNAKDGFLSKEDALKFKGADGKSVDMQKLDVDNDGKISQREWAAYHESAGAAGIGAAAKSKTTK
jgi:hypothetical protein